MRAFALALMLFAQPVQAQVRAEPGAGDPRLQTIAYDPDQVVQLPVASGYQLMVAFGSGEHIETIAVGDSGAWQVTANKRGDYLFVKKLEASRATNLTVVTDARIYSFELVDASGDGAQLPFVVRFLYPDAAKEVAVVPPDRPTYRYRFEGVRALRPKSISMGVDRIGIEWPSDVALPAVFRVDDDGEETLVNGEMQDGRFVVEGLPKKLVFRLDLLRASAVRVRGAPR